MDETTPGTSPQWPAAPRPAWPAWPPTSPFPPAPPPPRRHGSRARWALVGLAGGLAAIVGVGLTVNSVTAGHGRPSLASPVRATDPTTSSATARQTTGVVDIDTVLGYQGARAAGTGMILTSSGEVLTNNHVVDGATSIRVTVASTGATYTATVVGTDPTDDVAVIQLKDASGLKPIKADTSSVTVGQPVTGVGNAGGVGGTPSAATGTVLATGQTITASDENGANPETLHDLIETDAPIQAGDSGGPLYSSKDTVVGMDTAAQTASGGYSRWQQQPSTAQTGYAIPIQDALAIAKRIESGEQSATIHQGYPAFLGVEVEDAGNGALVAGLLPTGPAAGAGLNPGDLITGVDGTAVNSAGDLESALQAHRPGDQVTLHWTDQSGQTHSASVTLGTGPAD